MTLEVPESVTLPDGTIAQIKAVAATVSDGQLTRVIYTLEKANGAWAEVASEEFDGTTASDPDDRTPMEAVHGDAS